MALKRPNKLQYAMYDARGKAKYKRDLAAYHEAKREAEKKKNKLSTEKNIKKQKAANKKAATTTKTTKGKTSAKPTSTAAKGKSLATGKTTSKTKAVETPKTTTTTATKTRTRTRTKTNSKTTSKTTPKSKTPARTTPKSKTPARTTNKQPTKQPAKKGRPVGSKNKPRVGKQVGNFVKRLGKGAKDLTIKGYKKGKGLLDKSVKAYKNTPQNELKKPETKGQRAASGLKNLAKRTIDFQLENKRKATANIKDPKNIKSNVGGSALAIGARLAEQRLKRETDRLFKGDKTLSQYRKDKDAAIKKSNKATNQKIRKGVKNLVGNTINKVRGKGNNNQSSTTKNINKQKKVTTNQKLKVNKKQGPTVKSINRTDYNVDTKSGLAAYNKAKNNLTNKSSSSKPKKMHAIEKRNRKIFGDAHVDKLKAKHAAFKERRKKKKTLFRK